ncbi:unnamed protein product, partial [Closterium sp. NIES-65]
MVPYRIPSQLLVALPSRTAVAFIRSPPVPNHRRTTVGWVASFLIGSLLGGILTAIIVPAVTSADAANVAADAVAADVAADVDAASNATWRGDVAGVQAEAEELLVQNTELRRALGKLRQTVMLEARTRMAQLKSILKVSILKVSILKVSILKVSILKVSILKVSILKVSILKVSILKVSILKVSILKVSILKVSILKVSILKVSILKVSILKVSILKEIKLVQDQRALTFYVDDRHLPSPPPELKEIAALTARRRPDVDAKEEELVARAQVRVLSLREEIERAVHADLRLSYSRCAASLQHTLEAQQAHTQAMQAYMAAHTTLALRLTALSVLKQPGSAEKLRRLREQPSLLSSPAARNAFLSSLDAPVLKQAGSVERVQRLWEHPSLLSLPAARNAFLSFDAPVLKQPGSAEKLQQLGEQPSLLSSPAARTTFISSLDAPGESACTFFTGAHGSISAQASSFESTQKRAHGSISAQAAAQWRESAAPERAAQPAPPPTRIEVVCEAPQKPPQRSGEKVQRLREQPSLLHHAPTPSLQPFSPSPRMPSRSITVGGSPLIRVPLPICIPLYRPPSTTEASLWSDLLFSASHFPSIFLSTDHHPSRISTMQSLANTQNGTVLALKLRTDHAAAAVKEAKGKLPELCHVSSSWVSPEGADVSPCTLASRISEEEGEGKNRTSKSSGGTEAGAGTETDPKKESGPLSGPLAPSALWRQPLWDLSFPTHPSAFPAFPHSYAFDSPASSPFSSSPFSSFSSLLSSASQSPATAGSSVAEQSTTATDAATADAHTHSHSAESPGSSSASSLPESATSSPATSAAAVNISFLIYTSPPTTAALDLVSKLYECTHGRLRAGSIGGRLGGLTSEALVLLDGPSIPLHQASAMVRRGKTAGGSGSGDKSSSSNSSSSGGGNNSTEGIPSTVPGFEKYYNPADWIQATRRTAPGSFLTHILAPSRMGAARAYNLLSLLARGSVLILLAGGDLPPDSCDWAANLVSPFSAWPRLGIAGHSMGKMGLRNVPGSLQLGELRNAGDQFWNRLRDPVTGVRMSFVLGTVTGPMAARRDVFVKVGGFSTIDGGIDALSDWDLCQHVWLSGHQQDAFVASFHDLLCLVLPITGSDSIPQDPFRRQRHDSIGGGIPGAGGMRQMLTPGSAAAAAARQRRMSVQFASGFSKPTGLQLPGTVGGQGGPMTPTAGGNPTTATKKVQKSMMMSETQEAQVTVDQSLAGRAGLLSAHQHAVAATGHPEPSSPALSPSPCSLPTQPPKRKKRKSRWTKAWQDVQDFFQPISMLWQPWGILNPHSKFMARWNKVFMVACILGFTIDPWFLFTLQALYQVAPQPHIPSFTVYVESAQAILPHPVSPPRQAMLCLTLDWTAAITFTSFWVDSTQAMSNPLSRLTDHSLPPPTVTRQAMLCLTLDWTAAITFTVLRSFVDLCYVIQIVVQFRMAYIVPPPTNRKNRFFRRWWADRSLQSPGDLEFDARVIASRYLRSWFLIDVLAALPIPQVRATTPLGAASLFSPGGAYPCSAHRTPAEPWIVMLVIVPMMGRSVPSNTGVAMTVLCLAALFAQNVPRAIRFFPILSGNAPHVTGLVFETAWANFLLNFVFYLMASNIVGSMWYFLAASVTQRQLGVRQRRQHERIYPHPLPVFHSLLAPRLHPFCTLSQHPLPHVHPIYPHPFPTLPPYTPFPMPSWQRFTTCMAGQCATQGDACQPEYMYCVDQNAIAYQNTAAEAVWATGPASACLVADTPGSDAPPSPIDYGIFTNAVPLVVEGAFLSKYIYSFFWGFQVRVSFCCKVTSFLFNHVHLFWASQQVSTLAGNLEPSRWDPEQVSTLAGNLEPSRWDPEVLFVILVIGLGLVLLALLIGNISNFLQALSRRSLEYQLQRHGIDPCCSSPSFSHLPLSPLFRPSSPSFQSFIRSFEYQLQRHDIDSWMERRNLPLSLQKRVQKQQRLHWVATRGVEEAEVLDKLSDDIQTDVRRSLCLELLQCVSGAVCEFPGASGGAGVCEWWCWSVRVVVLECASGGAGVCEWWCWSVRVVVLECASGGAAVCEWGCCSSALFFAMEPQVLDAFCEKLRQQLYIEGTVILKEGYPSALFFAMEPQVLDAFCEKLRQQLYIEGTVILKEGYPVSRLFFVLRGQLESYTTIGGRAGFVDSVLLGKGDFLGEELLVEYLEKLSDGNKSRRSSTQIRYLGRSVTMGASASASAAALGTLAIDVLPTAQRTVRCIGPVEGYELEATDVAVVCRQFARMLATSKIQAALNECCHNRRTHAARTIQLAWRRHLRKKYGLTIQQ